jgi:hypothetical protein
MFVIQMYVTVSSLQINPLNSELNPACHLLTLLEAHRILHVSRIRVNHEYSDPNLYATYIIFYLHVSRYMNLSLATKAIVYKEKKQNHSLYTTYT